MSLGHCAETAAQDEDDWAVRDDNARNLIEKDDQSAVYASASSNDQVGTSMDAQNEEDQAADLAVLGDTCPICLQRLKDSVMLTICYHVYCFECLSTWVSSLELHGVELATCPLCKASFETVYANVRSESDYEVIRFQGRRIHDQEIRNKQGKNRQSDRQRLRRRSLVYRNKMRLVRVAGKEVKDLDTFPKMHKVKGGCGAKKCYDELTQALMPFLYEDAKQFVRELASFLGSRLNVEAYDAAVEYRCENAADCTNALCCGS
ncbi:unnamed protein product [Peronospora farinosa]|uniref:RING-type E3 ubiquitin transferase n=1 Tax=Peronospora farinosa TaxID=134698 RepID=A0AAV0TY31_9STRA|nr:unnamed protein product [Peronospora farinosa]CAI5729385.1 unnamed protein product [Peronospora farinosa]